MRLIHKRFMLSALLVTFVGVLASLTAASVSAQGTATKNCTLTSTPNVYTCDFTITPAIATGPGAWLVQMVPGVGTFASQPTVSTGTTGCGSLPSVTPGTLISIPAGTADYDVTIGSGGCSATAAVVITETVTVTASGQICQKVWISTASPSVTACASVVFVPPAPTGGPSASKTCTLTTTPNRYVCLYTVTPGFPAAAYPNPSPNGDFLHINEPPGPPMTGPGTFPFAPSVGAVSGCAEVPTPVVLTSPTSYNAHMGPSGCAGTTWSVQFIETVDVTASGQICQSFYMVAAVPPVTACASVVFVQPALGPSAVKTCTLAGPNLYTCSFTITPGVAAAPGDSWLVQMVSPGPGTFTSPSPVVSASTSGCGSGSSLPSITPGTLISSPAGTADYDVTIGSAGCGATAVVVITETIAVTASGQVCQTVWINVMSPGLTSCAPVVSTKMLLIGGSVPATGGLGLFVSGGGRSDELAAATGCPTATAAFWTSDGSGSFLIYVPGTAIAVVNAAWNVKFASGIPASTPLIGRCL